MPQRVGDDRRGELLDGLMRIVADRGFSRVKMAEIAVELGCSLATLYDIAPDKVSLVALAIGRWGETALDRAESRARQADSASERVRAYLLSGAASLAGLSHAFRRDVESLEVTRLAYLEISNGFNDRCAALIAEAGRAGEMRAVNPRFLAGLLRHMARAVRDEDLLERSGLTAAEAVVVIEELLWEGLASGHRGGEGPEPSANAQSPVSVEKGEDDVA